MRETNFQKDTIERDRMNLDWQMRRMRKRKRKRKDEGGGCCRGQCQRDEVLVAGKGQRTAGEAKRHQTSRLL